MYIATLEGNSLGAVRLVITKERAERSPWVLFEDSYPIGQQVTAGFSPEGAVVLESTGSALELGSSTAVSDRYVDKSLKQLHPPLHVRAQLLFVEMQHASGAEIDIERVTALMDLKVSEILAQAAAKEAFYERLSVSRREFGVYSKSAALKRARRELTRGATSPPESLAAA